MPVKHLKGGKGKAGIFRVPATPTLHAKVKTEEIKKHIDTELVAPVEKSLGKLEARELTRAAGISDTDFENALISGEIVGAEKQGIRWHISPTHLDAYIKEHK
jgi:hypothetical protein